MGKVAVSWSTAPDVERAVAEAIEKGLGALATQPSLAILFSTVDYDPDKVIQNARKGLGQVPIWGGTSFTGVLTPAGFIGSDKGSLGLMLLADIKAGVGTADASSDPKKAAEEAYNKAVEALGSQPQAILMMATPGIEERVLETLAEAAPGVPVVGGSAADNTIEGHWKVFGPDRALSAAVTLAAISVPGKVGVAFAGGYKPTDKAAKVTRADGRTVYELDGKPALEVYREWTGKGQDEVAGMNLLGASLLAPFGIEEAGFYRIVHLATGNDDGSIGAFAEVAEGTQVRLMETDVDKLIQDAADVAKEATGGLSKVEALVLSHCAGRRVAIGDRIGEVADRLKDALGDVPFIGFFSFGEQGYLPNKLNRHCNLMLSALAIGE